MNFDRALKEADEAVSKMEPWKIAFIRQVDNMGRQRVQKQRSVSVRIPIEDYKLLKKLAHRKGRTLASLVRRIIYTFTQEPDTRGEDQ